MDHRRFVQKVVVLALRGVSPITIPRNTYADFLDLFCRVLSLYRGVGDDAAIQTSE